MPYCEERLVVGVEGADVPGGEFTEGEMGGVVFAGPGCFGLRGRSCGGSWVRVGACTRMCRLVCAYVCRCAYIGVG